MKDYKLLTKRGISRRYRLALAEALAVYPLEVTSLRAVSMDTRPVFRVSTKADCFAAKFHDPREHALSQMRGEMQFLDHVARNSELCIETPLVNSNGEFVTEVHTSWLPQPAHVALCSWVEGRHLKHVISAQSYRHLGRCAALLHEVSPSFSPGLDFRILTNEPSSLGCGDTSLTSRPHPAPPETPGSLRKRSSTIATCNPTALEIRDTDRNPQ